MRVYCQNILNSNPCAPRNRIVRELIRDFDADVCFFQECGPQTNRIGDGEAPIVNLMDAILEEKETRKKVVVASTHLWWMFESEKDNLQRLQNVAENMCFFYNWLASKLSALHMPLILKL